jgi:hypothetical protein
MQQQNKSNERSKSQTNLSQLKSERTSTKRKDKSVREVKETKQ